MVRDQHRALSNVVDSPRADCLTHGTELNDTEGLQLASEADRLGFDEIWLAEHHGEDDGYNPSPAVAAGAIAAVTKRVRICFGIALAPLQGHPLRIAEDLAVADNFSGGRIEPGFGQGYRPEEFEAQGLDYSTRRSVRPHLSRSRHWGAT